MISHQPLLYSVNVVITVLFVWLPVVAQTSSTATSKPGTISGRVVNESGRPLRNARVSLERVGSMTQRMSAETTMTTTDREGKFEVSGLQSASYRIFAFREGYAPLIRDLEHSHALLYHVGDSVTLTLTKGGVITGAVTTQAGEPIVGVRVRAVVVHSANSLPFPYNRTSFSASTDDRGIYRIYGLPEGTYVVWAGGGGEMGSSVDAFENDVPTYAPASTRDTAQEIVVRAGAETNGVDILYRGGSGHAVSGIARGPEGKPLLSAIFMFSTSGPQWQTRASQDPNERGFMFQGVDDGDYFITAISQGPNGEMMVSASKQIKVTGADVTGVELIVQPLSSVVGRVVLEEIKTTECSDRQRPVFTETVVSAQSNAFNTVQERLGFLSLAAHADERGNVGFRNLMPGRYYFTTQHFAKDWYLKSLLLDTVGSKAGKPVDAARTWTTLKPGERLDGLTITLAQGAASVRGNIIVNKGETPAEKLYVYLVPAEKEKADDPLRFYSAAVMAEGKVALNNVAPGRYFVFAPQAPDESASPLTRLRSPDETAYRTRLRREAETVKTEIELKSCQRLTDVRVRVKTD